MNITLLLTVLGFQVAADALPAGPVHINPPSMVLTHVRQPRSLQVLGTSAAGYTLDLSKDTKFVSAGPAIARVDENGWVHPVSNGATMISVTVQGKTSTIPVEVKLPMEEPKYSFLHEVMPVLSQSGCNAGACHGYSLGKNGFKLSLRGSDPMLDYPSIAREFFGRRVDILKPDASLIVAKSRGDAAHEGGARFAKNSLSDTIMVNWIRQGTPDDSKDTLQVTGVRMMPQKLVLQPGQKHKLQLIADYNNGTTRDVTKLGIFTVNNDQFAKVDEQGMVTAGDAGETAIVGRFERTFAATGVLVLIDTKGFVPTPVPQNHIVDRAVIDKLNHLNIKPSGLCSDEDFLRRVYVDLIGVQPKPDETRSFLANKNPNKRNEAIAALFERPEFIDHWSLKWGDLLQNSRNSASSQSVYMFREFIRSAVASNMPMDKLATRLVTARGGINDDPASVYFTISKDTNDTVERVTQVFCGVRMLCARCHPHPMENWTQADYFGIASFFSQVAMRQDSRYQNVPNTKVVQLNLPAGFATNPRTGQAQPPRFLGGAEPKQTPGVDRRDAYASWLVSPDNIFFARGLSNRVWSYFFHRGIIDPVDDIRSTNPPINPALLDALTKDFIDNKYDIRKLMQRIVSSETYQRSSISNDSNKHDEQNFSRMIPRRIPAEALLDSLVQATGVPENYSGAPGGFRAAQLPDGNVESSFLKLFGKPQRMDACECERDNGSNMLQALHFINGKSIMGRLQNPAARPAVAVRLKTPDPELVSDLYLWCFARLPNAKEVDLSLAFLKSAPADKRAEAIQDLMWALLNSKDFQMLH